MKRFPFFALLGACLLAYAPVIGAVANGAWPFQDDAITLFNVWRDYSAQALKSGTLPLWNPHTFAGMPFLANNQTAVLYPPNLVYLLLPMAWAMVADAFGHTLLLGVGGYVFGRALRLSRAASLLGALVLMLGAPVSAHVGNGHFTWTAARAWLPWQLWATLLLMRHARRTDALRLALLVWASVAAGYPPIAILNAALCFGLIVAWTVSHRAQTRPFFAPRLRALSMAGALAGLLCAAYVLPFYDISRASSHATGLEWDVATRDSATWKSFVRLLLPGFFGGNADGSWSATFPHEETGAVGVLALALALLAPWLARERGLLPRAVPWLWALLPVSALLALGRHTPVYGLAFQLPLFNATRVPARWLEVWYLACAFGCAFGCEALLRGVRQGAFSSAGSLSLLKRVLGAALFVSAGATAWALLSPDTFWEKVARAGVESGASEAEAMVALRFVATFEAMLGVVWAGAALLALRFLLVNAATTDRLIIAKRLGAAFLLLSGAELCALFVRSAKTVAPGRLANVAEWPRALTWRARRGERWDANNFLSANEGIRARIDTWGGYDALSTARFFEFVSPMEGQLHWGAAYWGRDRGPLMRVAGVTHLVSPASGDAPQKLVKRGRARLVAASGEWRLFQLTGALARPYPRAYLSRDVHRAPIEKQPALVNALAHEVRPAFPVVVAPESFLDVRASASNTDGVRAWKREQDTFSVECQASAPSVLVVSEANFKGWRAWVNERETPVHTVNALYRGVQVPRGASKVAMVYAPTSWQLGAFASLCGLMWLAALLVRGTAEE